MVRLERLVAYLDELLTPASFSDYCPNGLQVEGRAEVRRIIGGVTASQALLEAAVERGCDALLVHHGYFWKGEDPRVVGIKRRRLGTLLSHDISLLAYHLPLDAHPVYGNNAEFGRLLRVAEAAPVATGYAAPLVWQGRLAEPLTGADLARRLATVLGREPLYVGQPGRRVGRIAWCTGAAQGLIEAAAAVGVDAYITGEVSEPTVHIARETGLEFYAAGHHATERYGVQALGAHLQEQWGVEFHFIDIDNPA